MKKWIWVLLVFGLLSMPWSGQAQTWQESFQEQIQNWAKELSSQDQRFSPFVTSSFSNQPLGTEQWLVTFYSDQREMGYMIVGEGEKEFFLLEYGLGEYILFDEEPAVSLQSAPSSRTPIYAGLQSIWVSKEGLFDAKSGEKYPMDTQIKAVSLSSFIRHDDTLTAVKANEPLQHEEPWIKPGDSIKTEQDLVDLLNDHVSLSFIGHLFDGHVLAPFSVLGFHKWGSNVFVELEDDGSRFVPFQHAVELGGFYK